MAIFFKGEYPKYYDLLGDVQGLKTSSNNMASTCEAVKTELQGVYALFSELSGDYSAELLNSFQDLSAVIETTLNTINNDLPPAIDAMSNLHEDLGEMKPKDETYEGKKNSFDKMSEPSKYTTNDQDEKVENPAYKTYHDLKNELNKLVKELEDLVKSSDSEIDLIKTFNDKVVEMRMTIASFQYATENSDFEGFDKLTIEEQEAFVQDLIDRMTEKYQQYKTAYENYVRFTEHMTEEQLDAFSSILMSLHIASDGAVINLGDGDYTPFGGMFFGDDDSADAATRGLAMLDLLVLIDQNKVVEKVNAYLVDGKSWQESGMEDLYISFYPGLGSMGTADQEMWTEILKEKGESMFWGSGDGMGFYSMYYDESKKAELAKSFNEAMEIYRTDCEGFKENFTKAGNAAIAAQGLKEMKKHMRYDNLTVDEDFKNFDPTWDPNDENTEEMLYDLGFEAEGKIDHDYYEWYNEEEMKTLEYLYSKDPEQAKQYIADMNSTVRQRKGYTEAKNFYDGVHSGSNEGWDAVGDHLGTYVKGFETGVYKFGDNLCSLFSPDVDYNSTDYMHMSLISMLNSDDPYDKGLLTAYNIGETSGEVVVPLVVSLFSKTGAAALTGAATIGGDMKQTSIAMHNEGRNVTYDQLLALAGTRYATKKGVGTFTGQLGSNILAKGASQLLGDSTSSMFKNNDEMLDMFYGHDAEQEAMKYVKSLAPTDSIMHEEDTSGFTLGDVVNVGGSADTTLKNASGELVTNAFGNVVSTITGNKEAGEAAKRIAKPVTSAGGKAAYEAVKDNIVTPAFAEGTDEDSSNTANIFEDFADGFVSELAGSGDKTGTKLWSNGQSVFNNAKTTVEDYRHGVFSAHND